MQRPVMHPVFRAEDVTAAKQKTPKWKTFFKTKVVGSFKGALRMLVSSPVKMGRRAEVENRAPLASRLVRGLAYRALFLPVLVALSSATLVFTGTHPSLVYSATDPATFGVYFDPVAFESEDGTRLEGWIAPVIDAKAIIEKRDKILRSKHPAVVLVHDFAKSPQQLLPLFAPLHEDGLIVMAVGLRGTNASTFQTAGQTFGLREAMDVSSTVEALRADPFVDTTRIAIVGVGTGANAAVIAASKDPHVKATVLVDPLTNCDDVIRQHIGPNHRSLRWMQPLSKLTFELAYRVDAEDMDVERFPAVVRSRPCLRLASGGDEEFLAKPATVKMVREFLTAQLRLDKLPPRTAGGVSNNPVPRR
jgi:pimeloyl-ACP methyl ester carboxylesterase